MNTRYLTAAALLVLATACAKKAPPLVYEPIPVARRDIVVSASASGAVEPITTIDVKSKASGEVLAVYVDTGDSVKTGQHLVKIDPRTPHNALLQAQANIEVAKAQVENAGAQLKRAEELHKTAAISDQDYETAKLADATAKAQLVAAQRTLEDAKISFEDTDVRAPSNGTILARTVAPGTMISSATTNVGGGTVLLQMASLDTVQVRSLVDETDVGKIQPGMPVTITVDAYPNRTFSGDVLKIEPQATVQQNVTMFPVLVRIPNPGTLLKPGMNTEVEVHVGARQNVLAVPNAALRTQRDVSSAAGVLGLNPDEVMKEIAAAQQRPADSGRASLGATTAADPGKPDSAKAGGEKFTTQDGREVALPAGIKAADVRDLMTRMSSGGFQSLTDKDRALMQQLRQAGVFRRPGGGGGPQGGRGFGAGYSGSRGNSYLFGGSYIVFVLRNGKPTPVPIRTGLTDLDYSEVVSGLTDKDTVLILPSASLVQQQEQSQQMQQRIRSSAMPGMGGGGRR
jgi:HlyD family secretion protein